MVGHIPMKKFAVYAPNQWNNNLIMCWASRAELELLKECSKKELAIAPVITSLKNSSEFDPNHFQSWRYVPSTRSLEKSNVDDLDSGFAAFSTKAQQWVKGLSAMAGIINFFRTKNSHGLWEKQAQVYEKKLEEARRVLSSDSSDLIFLPLEAEERQITMLALAKEIVLAHRLDIAALAKTETMRIRWMSEYRCLIDNDQNISDFVDKIHKEAYDHQRS